MWKKITALGKVKPSAPAMKGAQHLLSKSSPPMLQRFKMMVRLANILGKETTSVRGRPRLVDTRIRHSAKSRQKNILKRMRLAMGGKKAKPKKKEREDSNWKRCTLKAPPVPNMAPIWRMPPEYLEDEDPEKEAGELEVQIRLTTVMVRPLEEVRFNFNTCEYEQVVEDDPLLDLLTLPSVIIHKNKLSTLITRPVSVDTTDPEYQVMMEMRRQMEELYKDVVTKEELDRIDTQPNPFNFSDRVSQTTRVPTRNLAMQTKPPPDTKFTVNVGPSDIYYAYQKDHEDKVLQEKKRFEEEEKERERKLKGKRHKDPVVLIAPPASKPKKSLEKFFSLAGIKHDAILLERMVAQNAYDDIIQDFKYWEDASDEYHPMEGSLLPLWKFKFDLSRIFMVSDISWNPIHPDLFAASYTTGDVGGDDSLGMVCVYSLKNPSTPERVFHTASGIMTVQFHPQDGGKLVAGWSDGSVAVYDIHTREDDAFILSHTTHGKHLLPVTKVQWIRTLPTEDLSFFSISLDGHFRQWHLCGEELVHCNIIEFKPKGNLAKHKNSSKIVELEGVPLCIAVQPEQELTVLVGVDTGTVFQWSVTSINNTLLRYPAHMAPVRGVAWNVHHHKIFLTCSMDWTLKIWLERLMSPLITLDMGGAIAGAAWSPYSSSVVVVVTEESCIHVYDLYQRKCRPLCVQPMAQKKRLTSSCVSFSPFYHVVLIGGERGHLTSLKLSPNLRKPHKDAKGADEQQLKEIELSKMERLISTNRG